MLPELMERSGVPGVAVGVLSDDAEDITTAGITSVDNPLPVQPTTLFQIGSITKTVTATTILRLVEQGRLDLETPVHRYLPSLRLADEDVQADVNLRHLLTHTAGWQGDYFLDTGAGDDALERYVASLAELPQLVPLGTLFSYCNSGFAVASRVVEVVCGKTYEQAARELVLEPLGMEHSFFFPAEVMTHRFAVGHRSPFTALQNVAVLRPWGLPRATAGVGGLTSCIPDMLRYARFVLGGGPPGFLSAELRTLMQTPLAQAGNFADFVGTAWMLRDADGGTRVVEHSGSTHGQQATLKVVPERNFALVVLTNSSRGDEVHGDLAVELFRQHLGLEAPAPTQMSLAAAQLEEFVGAYETSGTLFELVASEGGLVVNSIPKGGFPTADTPPPPPPPPSRFVFWTQDRLIGIDGPMLHDRAEFVRDADGPISHVRIGGRLARREGSSSPRV